MNSSNIKIGVVGGGPAGMATAIQLKQYNFDVVLFEASEYDRITVGEHLAAEAIHEFKKLQIPEALLNNHSIPCKEVQNAWGHSKIHHNESIFNPFGAGYILSRPNFDNALLDYCSQIGIDTKKGTRISKIKNTETDWELHANSEILKVDFLVDASGRTSKFNFGNKKTKKTNNQLIGITKYLYPDTTTLINSSHLLVESTPTGWWYTVQIASSTIISTFMTDASFLTKSEISHHAFWNRELANSLHTKARVKDTKIPADVFIKSAHSHMSNQTYGDKWLKVGDAAQSFDPLSSAGILKGLKMGQQAAIAIHDYVAGNTNSFKRYENEIRNQYTEYLELKADYYAKETRWMHESFWYQRNLSLKSIQHFTITPQNTLTITDSNLQEKLLFLTQLLPEIHFEILIDCIRKYPLVKKAIELYLKKTNSTGMNSWLLHALESLKIIGVIS